MSGVEIEYLLGIYFIVSTITVNAERQLAYDLVRLVAGVILVLLAVFGFSLIR